MSRAEELKTLQALPLDIKIKKTQLRIKEAIDEFGKDGLYLSFSGGKDSCVLLDIIRKMGGGIEVVYCNTGLEDSGSTEIGMREADTILRPELSFIQVIQKYGYPIISKEVAKVVESFKKNERENKPQTQWIQKRLLTGYYKGSAYDFRRYYSLVNAPFDISNKCCQVNKENPLFKYQRKTKKIPIMGLMATESRRRAISWVKNGCNSFTGGRKTSRPIMFWTEQDILQYIKEHNIKIAKEYGEIIDTEGQIDLFGNCKHCYKLTGQNRTGCKFCMFGISMDRSRMLFYKENDRQFYDYAMRGGEFVEGIWKPKNGLGLKFVIDWLNENIETFKKRPILY